MSRRPAQLSARLLAGANVVLAGLFSARDKTVDATLDALTTLIESCGGRVAARCAQRRGVSHGGADLMAEPFSRRTLISLGKVRDLDGLCRTTGASVVVFNNPLTEHQRHVLQDLLGRPVFSGEDLRPRGE